MNSYSNSDFGVKYNKLTHKNNIEWVGSPNFSKNIDPKFLVLHYTASSSIDGTFNTFKSSKSDSSAHFTIDYDGQIYQHVPLNRKAWHAGKSTYAGYNGLNSHSFGIELENYGHMEIIGDGRYKTWFGKVVERGDEFHTGEEIGFVETNHPNMSSKKYAWCLPPSEQIESTILLSQFLMKKYNLLECVKHDEISVGRKWDTGPILSDSVFSKIEGRIDDENQKPSIDNYEIGTVYTRSRLNMRDEPWGEVIDKLLSGERVKIIEKNLGKDGKWLKVVTFKGSTEGYVHKSFIK